MATRFSTDRYPSGPFASSTVRDRVHESGNFTQTILDFPGLGNRTWHSRIVGGGFAEVPFGGMSATPFYQVTTFARSPNPVARRGDPPQIEHPGSSCLAETVGPAAMAGRVQDRRFQ